MSNGNPAVKTGLSSVQVYSLAAICLLIGITAGYLVRGSSSPKIPAASAVQTQGGNPAGALPPNAKQPSADDMKRMADKQVAPLLEQLKQNPKDYDTLAKVGHFYLVAEQYQDAATYYAQATQIKPNPMDLTELSSAYYYSGSTDKAIEALNQALKIDPKFPNALFNLGMLKWQVQGDTKGAIDCWERLLNTNLDPQHRAEVQKMIARAKEHSNIAPGTKTDKPAM